MNFLLLNKTPVGEEGEGGDHRGELTQTMYAHVNKWIIKKKKLQVREKKFYNSPANK
jgi:hypothetical protein